jgi:hypothetical protein
MVSRDDPTMMKTKSACPGWAQEEIRSQWGSWASGVQSEWLKKNPRGTKEFKAVSTVDSSVLPPTITGSVVVPESMELDNIRNWREEVDGISAERLRNCIIYQLDYAKNSFYRTALTVGYLKRVRRDIGVTGARRLHEDTPPGWMPPEKDPLIKTVTMKIDDEAVEITSPSRRAKNSAEWQRLQKLLLDSKGLVNSNIVPFVVDSKCQLCHGTGFEAVLAHPDNPRLRWQKRSRDCSCLFKNPFA